MVVETRQKREEELSERVVKLRKPVIDLPYVHDTERLKIMMDVYREAEPGEPTIMLRAKFFDRVMSEKTIYIDENPIVGTVGRGQNYNYSYPEYSAEWMGPAVTVEGFGSDRGCAAATEEDMKITKEAYDYWKERCMPAVAGRIYDKLHPEGPNYKTMFGTLSVSTHQTPLPMGLPMPDWADLMKTGLNGRIAKAEEKMRELKLWDRNDLTAYDKYNFYQAVIISLKAVINNAHRYADLAKKMAKKEADPQRQQELLRIAETCKRVPAKPPRNFYEAVQFHWFIIVANLVEESGCGTGPQRFSLYMYPYYKKDIEEGRITKEEALELLECLFCKYRETTMLTDLAGMKGQGGQTSKYFTIGGLTADGRDATNEIDFLLLETQRRMQLPEPALTLLYHNKLSDEFLHEVVRLLRTSIGQPQLQNNEVGIQREIHHHGCSVEEAREGLASTYCVSMGLKNAGFLYGGTFNAAKLIELVLNNGTDPFNYLFMGLKTGELESLTSYEKFWEAFVKQLEYHTLRQREMNLLEIAAVQQNIPQPLRSAITDDCLDKGVDWLSGARYPTGGPLMTAAVDAINSLAAIKKLVYDDKKITLEKLKEVLAANFVGFEKIQKMCFKAPKFGNDDEYADQIARRFWDTYYDIYKNSPLNRDMKGSRPEPYSIAVHVFFGCTTGALPTGRPASEFLTDASVSAQRGTDTQGPTALIKSAAGAMDTVKYGCNHLNVRFHPSALEGEEGERNLLSLIKTYMDLGGSHIQFNCVSTETLKNAQVQPAQYEDLVVRVAGFSAFYVHLDKMIQDEIIERTEVKFGC